VHLPAGRGAFSEEGLGDPVGELEGKGATAAVEGGEDKDAFAEAEMGLLREAKACRD
jgi:hypothetical protein